MKNNTGIHKFKWNLLFYFKFSYEYIIIELQKSSNLFFILLCFINNSSYLHNNTGIMLLLYVYILILESCYFFMFTVF